MEKNPFKGLRNFAYSFSAGMAIFCAISILKGFPLILTLSAFILSLYHLFCGIFFYRGAVPSFIVLKTAGRIIGIIITNSIFTIVYYLFFTPIAVILRLTSHDKIRENSLFPGWAEVSEKDNSTSRIGKLY